MMMMTESLINLTFAYTVCLFVFASRRDFLNLRAHTTSALDTQWNGSLEGDINVTIFLRHKFVTRDGTF